MPKRPSPRAGGDDDPSSAPDRDDRKPTLRRDSGGEADPLDPPPRGIWADPRAPRRLLLLLAALMVAFSVTPLSNNLRGRKNKDYNLWYRTGEIVRQGGEVYPTDGRPFPFMYPPSAASMLAVAGLPGEHAFVAMLLLVNSAAWAASLLLSVYLATGRALGRHPLLYLVPSLAVIPFVHDTYLLGQPNLLLLALMLGAFAGLRHHRPWLAGALIATAAAIKAFPVLAAGYLVYRRQWKATASLLATLAVLLIVLPLPFRGLATARVDLTTWVEGMVLKYDADTIAQRPERCYSFKNHSVMALANRLLRPIPADGEADDDWTVNVADLDFAAVNAAIAASALGLGLFYVLAMPPGARRTARTDAIEQAMLLLLILDFSPLCFNYFYIWLIYPLAVALGLALEAPAGSAGRRRGLAWVAAPLVLLALAIPFLREAQAYGNLFFAGLVLLVGLGRELRRSALPPEADAPGAGSARPASRPEASPGRQAIGH